MSGATYYLNGKEVTAKKFRAGGKSDWLKASPMIANTYNEHDPLLSEALGCMKSQVPEMRQLLESEGVQGVGILDSGQARITSRRGRNHLMRLLTEIRGNKYHDIDGGYSDG
jgi:hypothetical protein|tara:strand:- start:678 stop:1013 length:336 start_codon:yes stop_codon:yes gene_type:complete